MSVPDLPTISPNLVAGRALHAVRSSW